MTHNSSIRAFDYFAKEYCRKLFGGSFITYPEFLVKTNYKEALKDFQTMTIESEEPEFHNYETYVYSQTELWTIEEAERFLEICSVAYVVYFCYPTEECTKGRSFCFYWETTHGLYLILAESNHAGNVEQIFVRVYEDPGIFFTDIIQLFERFRKYRLIRTPHKNYHDLMADLITR